MNTDQVLTLIQYLKFNIVKDIKMGSGNLYKGEFNWYGEVHEMYTHASSEALARRQFIYKLSKKLGQSPFNLINYFSSSSDNHSITIQTKGSYT